MDATPVQIMHLIYPGMSRSVPVIVGEPVTESGYTGYVWTIKPDDIDAEPAKTHCSRLNRDPIG